MEVKNVDYVRVIRGKMLHFKPGALIRWRAENSQVSFAQLKIRESTGLHELQGFGIASIGKPKPTVGSSMELEVFDGFILRIHVNLQTDVIYNLTRIVDIHAEIRDQVNVLI